MTKYNPCYDAYYNEAQSLMVQAYQAHLDNKDEEAVNHLVSQMQELIFKIDGWDDEAERFLPIDLVDEDKPETEEAAEWVSKRLDLPF